MTGYELSRSWFDFAFENPEKICPGHTAVFMFAIEHCNRLGWKNKFGFPSQMTMDAVGIKSHHSYIRYFKDLVEWGFFKLVQKSSNQYSSNIISLSSAMLINDKALDKARTKHESKHGHINGKSKDSIDKPITIKPKTRERVKRFTPPTFPEVLNYMIEKGINSGNAEDQTHKFINHYTSNGWMVGKNKMKDWRAAVRSNWLKDINLNGASSEYTYKEVLEIDANKKDHRLFKDFEAITPGELGTKWKLK